MFDSFLASIPKNRSDMVNDLELPDDVPLTPYIWTEPEESLLTNDSLVTTSFAEVGSSESSLSLSRAMTDSEIDYDRYRRYKTRSLSDPWIQMRVALDALPPDYLESINSFRSPAEVASEAMRVERSQNAEELRLRMEKFFEEECRVFSPEDPGLLELEEALEQFELKDSDLENITP